MGSQLQRYALAVVSHLALVVAWYFFVVLGKVPKFVMPSPYDTLQALLVPNYRWMENIAVTATEIFGGYVAGRGHRHRRSRCCSPGSAGSKWRRCRCWSAST